MNLTEDITTLIESLDDNNVYRIQKGRVLDDDNEPIKDDIAAGLQTLVEGNKNPLSEYNEAFRNLQARRRMKPMIPGSAKEKTRTSELAEGITLHTAIDVPQRQEGASEFATRLAARIDIDSKAEDGVENDGMSISYQPGAASGELEAEFTFASMGADDVALDMDTEVEYRTKESSGESEDDLNDSMYEMS